MLKKSLARYYNYDDEDRFMIQSDLFNSDSVCIFTDSSFKESPKCKSGTSIGTTAPAYCVYFNNSCIEQDFHILHDSTSQQGEMYAMLLGIRASYRYRNWCKYIRIFSDSQNTVFAIRDRMVNWASSTNNGIKILGSDGSIKNQGYLMMIVNEIMSNNIPLILYHVKGHVNIKSDPSIISARKTFLQSNPFITKIDNNDIYRIAMGNNAVDEYSTVMLRSNIDNPRYKISKTSKKEISVEYYKFDINRYSKLVNYKG